MGSHAWDVVAVGAGHNGLVAAAYLAKAGKRVLVVERQPYLGGGVASAAYTLPGFLHERHGFLHAKIMANPLITADELDLQSRHGLSYIRPADSYGAIFEDGSWIGLSRDRGRTLDCLAHVVPEDVRAYDRFAGFASDAVQTMIPGLFSPPADLGSLLSAWGGTPDGRRLSRVMLQSAVDVICEHFGSDKLRAALIRLVAELLVLHPDEKGTGLFAVAAVGIVDRFGFGFPRGGGDAFTGALVRCLEAHGGAVAPGTAVREVVLRDGRAVGVRTDTGETILANDAVLAAIHPHRLGEMVPGLPDDVVGDAGRVQPSHYTGFVLHGALAAPLRFRTEAANGCALVNVGVAGVDATLRAFDRLKRGSLPDEPLIWSTALPDAERAPPGRGVLHCYGMVCTDVENTGAAGWHRREAAVAAAMLDRLGAFTEPLRFEPGPESLRVVTPVEHEADSPSFSRGDVNGAGMFLHQTGSLRPTAALSGYAVPGAAGLYLTGPFMHPGGGITGGGRATAVRMFADLDIPFGPSASRNEPRRAPR